MDSSGGCRLIGGLARGEVATAGDGGAGDVRAEAATTGDARGSIPSAGDGTCVMKSNAAAGPPEDEREDEWAAEGALRDDGCAAARVFEWEEREGCAMASV